SGATSGDEPETLTPGPARGRAGEGGGVEREWVWRQPEGPVPEALVAAFAERRSACADVVARLLWNRGVTEAAGAEAFLRPTLARGLRSPSLLKDMDRAVRRLADALAAGETIAV